MLRQMRGRAGRKGKDEIGETYLCCRKADLEEVISLMHAEPQRYNAIKSGAKQTPNFDDNASLRLSGHVRRALPLPSNP